MVSYEMQLTGENVAYDGVGKFEFPVNPMVLTFPLVMDRKIREMPYNLHHVITTGGGIKPREIVLNGTFHGSSKLTSYNGLSEFIISTDVCRFWLNSTSFYFVLGSGIRQSLSNEKINFVDYVATLLSVSPFVYSTARSANKTSGGSTSFTHGSEFATETLTNTGNARSVAKITVVAGAAITKVEVGELSTLAASKFKVIWNGNLASGETLVIYPFKLFNPSDVGDVKSIRLGHPEINGSLSGTRTIPGMSVPFVEPNTTTQRFSVKLTGSAGSSTVTLDWFDANVG